MIRRQPVAQAVDAVGLVATVVGIDTRLRLFRRRLVRFGGGTASRPEGTGHWPVARAPHPQHGNPAMPP